MTPPIRANTVLPAEREQVTLHTTDGLALVGELAVPDEGPPKATIVCLHPLPTHGGSMDSQLIRKMAWRLPALAQIAVLRFNTRGTAGSEGHFDGGDDERYDLAAALDLVEYRDLPSPWLVGWSFGAELTLMYGWEDPSIVGAVVLAPPLHRAGEAELAKWAEVGKPLVAVVPENDDYLRPDEARRRFAAVPQAEVVEIARSGHLFVGYAEEALDAIVEVINPSAAPLPQEWP
jgi:uncharacterized protein